MPEFFGVFISVFFLIFIGIFAFVIYSTLKAHKNNNKPIRQFTIYGKTYLLFSVISYNRYSNAVVYQLKDEKGELLGSFNSLEDVLTFLSIKEFPRDDSSRYY